MQTEFQELSALVGAEVIAAERARWGFENRTDIVTLADGQRRVVQRIVSRELAPHTVRLARTMPERFAAVGLRLPVVLAADADADPPYVVREYIHGVPAATLMSQPDTAIAVAQMMGALLPRLAQIDTAGLGLETTWADGARLARQARQHLARCRALLDEATIALLEQAIADVPHLLIGRGVFAHGDFCPVNALVEDDGRQTMDDGTDAPAERLRNEQPASLVALLDVEFARVADPLFDAAWWGWVVRYHHYERWLGAWPELLAAAGIANDDLTNQRVRVLQVLRCLEMLGDNDAMHREDKLALWAQRSRETAAWT